MSLSRRWMSPLVFAALVFLLLYGYPRQALSQDNWKTEWEKTLAEAKQEGEVVAYASSNYESTLREFHKRYPEIEVRSVLAPGRLLGQRILAERRAEKFIPDMYIDGTGTGYRLFRAKALEPAPVLSLPEVRDQSKWFQGKHHYVDPAGRYLFVFEGSAQSGGIAYNTKLVEPQDLTSYWDLVNPKWKGKIIAVDPESRGPVSQNLRFYYHNPKLGPDFLRRLFGEMDIKLIRNRRQIVDWLAVGRYAFGLFTTGITDAKEVGLPVDEFYPGHFKEGALVDSTLGAMGLINNAPHPNAVKVLINWLLSKEGQIAFQRQGNNPNSMREDIPKDEVARRNQRNKGIEFIMTGRADWIDMRPIYRLIRQARKTGR